MPDTSRLRVRFCREGWVYFVVLSILLTGALLRQMNLLMILFGMLVGPMLFSWRLVRKSLRKLEVERKLPTSAMVGTPLYVGIEVKNPRRSASWSVALVDRIARTTTRGEEPSEVYEPAIWFNFIPAHGTRHGTYKGQLSRRGKYLLGPVKLRTRFPLGLISCELRVQRAATLIVLPRIGRLRPAWSRLSHVNLSGESPVERQQTHSEGDFYGLRDWRPGDSRRWIHWRTSARRQTLVVRQFEQHRMEELLLLVDLWRPEEPSETQLATVEQVISFAATVVADAARRGLKTLKLCILTADGPQWHDTDSRGQSRQALESLAVAQPVREDRLAEALAHHALCAGRSGQVIVASSRPAGAVSGEDSNRTPTHAHGHGWQGKLHWLDASHAGLDPYFSLD